MKCRCGNITESIKSYFSKENGMRVTGCEKCTEDLGLNNKEKYYSIDYDKLNREQLKTPEPLANRN